VCAEIVNSAERLPRPPPPPLSLSLSLCLTTRRTNSNRHCTVVRLALSDRFFFSLLARRSWLRGKIVAETTSMLRRAGRLTLLANSHRPTRRNSTDELRHVCVAGSVNGRIIISDSRRLSPIQFTSPDVTESCVGRCELAAVTRSIGQRPVSLSHTHTHTHTHTRTPGCGSPVVVST